MVFSFVFIIISVRNSYAPITAFSESSIAAPAKKENIKSTYSMERLDDQAIVVLEECSRCGVPSMEQNRKRDNAILESFR